MRTRLRKAIVQMDKLAEDDIELTNVWQIVKEEISLVILGIADEELDIEQVKEQAREKTGG